MKRFADSIARQKGIRPPAGYTKSGSVCRAFLEQHAPKKTVGAGENTGDGLGARPPSPAQLSFAESISREKGVAIIDEAKANSAAMSAWIDKNQGSTPGKGRRKTITKNSNRLLKNSTFATILPK
jgi:DNA topoisomerase-3